MTSVAPVVAFEQVTRFFGGVTALRDVTVHLPQGAIIGLLGRNGSGKTTLLHHVSGRQLPSRGRCLTLGVDSARLSDRELARLGIVAQHGTLVSWMTAQRLVRYVAGFHPSWDAEWAATLLRRLEIDPSANVGTMSPGTRQKLALVLALGHRPELLLLDEPLSDLDPAARREVLQILLEQFERDRPTIVLSSHLLHDIEPVITHVVCLHDGAITADAELDLLKETYTAWRVAPTGAALPTSWRDPQVVHATGDALTATLIVRRDGPTIAEFAEQHALEVAPVPLDLETMFPLLTSGALRDGVRRPAIEVRA